MQAQAREGNPGAWGFAFSFTDATLASAGAVRCAAPPLPPSAKTALSTFTCQLHFSALPASPVQNVRAWMGTAERSTATPHITSLSLTGPCHAPPVPACSWEQYTLDGSPTLLPPADSTQDQQAKHFLDFYSTEDLQQADGTVSRTKRTNLLQGVTAFNMVAKGFYYGGWGAAAAAAVGSLPCLRCSLLFAVGGAVHALFMRCWCPHKLPLCRHPGPCRQVVGRHLMGWALPPNPSRKGGGCAILCGAVGPDAHPAAGHCRCVHAAHSHHLY